MLQTEISHCLKDNHYKTICGSARSESSSCRVLRQHFRNTCILHRSTLLNGKNDHIDLIITIKNIPYYATEANLFKHIPKLTELNLKGTLWAFEQWPALKVWLRYGISIFHLLTCSCGALLGYETPKISTKIISDKFSHVICVVLLSALSSEHLQI